MKNLIYALIAIAPLSVSCDGFFLAPEPEKGELRISFSPEEYLSTRSFCDIPDTNSFLLRLCTSSGEVIYDGLFGAAPESFALPSGAYSLDVVSAPFETPSFSVPQYGDSRIVMLNPSDKLVVRLICTQLNSGLRIKAEDSFCRQFAGGYFILDSEEGRLDYAFDEERTAYFKPGEIAVSLSCDDSVIALTHRLLAPKEVLTLNVSNCNEPIESGEISFSVDSSRNWTFSDYKYGEGAAPGSSIDNALDVYRARGAGDVKSVWVYGYIVGGDLTSSNCSFSAPFTSETNLVIASKSSVADRSYCLSVQLPKGPIRDALNLVGHPENLGRAVFFKGDLVTSYYGLPGIRNIKEYSFK